MSLAASNTRAPTSPTHDAFRLMFEAADMVSIYWQPFLKGIGRWQLELAQVGAKQSRAAIEFGNRLTQSTNPVDLVNAQTLYWQQVGQAYSDAGQNISQAFARASEMPAGIEIMPAQKKRAHDTMWLEEPTSQRGYEDLRKVA